MDCGIVVLGLPVRQPARPSSARSAKQNTQFLDHTFFFQWNTHRSNHEWCFLVKHTHRFCDQGALTNFTWNIPIVFESWELWAWVFLLNLQCVIGARWPSKWRCHHKKINSSREYYTLISLISQTIFKQLQMQPFKHPCIVWGIHLPDIVLPWQKYSCQNIPFIHKLQFSFEERH